MNAAAITETIRRAVLEAAREHALLETPGCVHEIAPPTAIEHERRIIGALLAGKIPLEDLVPLSVRDFYQPLHQAIVIAIEVLGADTDAEITIAKIVIALKAQGLAGSHEEILDALEGLVLDAPTIFDLNEARAEVLDAAQRRKLLRVMQQVTADLRLGHCSAGQGLRKLQEISLG